MYSFNDRKHRSKMLGLFSFVCKIHYYPFVSVAFLLITTHGDRDVNVIPEVYEVPSGEKGSLFGAGLALKGQSIWTAAPYWNGNGQIFGCPLTGSKQCTQKSSASSGDYLESLMCCCKYYSSTYNYSEIFMVFVD